MASFIKLKRPNTTLLLALGIGLLTFIIISTLWAFRRVPPRQADIENELNQIASPAGATATQHNVINKWTHGNIGNYYRADLSYDQIRAHYDAELARHGWTFQKQVPLTSWGKDMGESQTFYCKGNHTADIYFTGREESRLGYRYALDVSWGLYDCP